MDDRIKAVFNDVFHLNGTPFTDELGMQDIEAWDSLTHLELVTRLEEAFGIRFSPEQIVELTSVAQIKRFLTDFPSN